MSSPLFEAQYYSQCPECEKKIRPGDSAGFNSDQEKVVCEECWVDEWEY